MKLSKSFPILALLAPLAIFGQLTTSNDGKKHDIPNPIEVSKWTPSMCSQVHEAVGGTFVHYCLTHAPNASPVQGCSSTVKPTARVAHEALFKVAQTPTHAEFSEWQKTHPSDKQSFEEWSISASVTTKPQGMYLEPLDCQWHLGRDPRIK